MRRILSAALCLMLTLCAVTAYIPSASAVSAFYSKAEMVQIKSNIETDAGLSQYVSTQGACTDGKYAYIAMPNGTTTMLKYDLSNWQLVKKKTGLALGHANDMTYNSTRDYIAVSHNAPEYNIISIVDPKTLKVTEQYEIKLNIYSIAYCVQEDCYFVGISGGYNFARLDNEFNVVEKYKNGVKTGYLRQGCDCDENYVYFTQSGGSNIVMVYDHEGNYVDDFALASSHEVESFFHYGNNFFATFFYYGNSLYRVGINDYSKITYRVNYDPGDGWGEMTGTTVHYGDDTPLSANTFSRYGYFFGGWRTLRSTDNKWLGYRKGSTELEWLDQGEVDTYKIYPDKAPVSRTVKYGTVTMTPLWISEYYDINFTSDNAEGYIPSQVVKYRDTVALPENAYTKPGYVFRGYIAERTYDGKHYGYRKGAKKPEWLHDDELYEDYFFSEGEEVSRMTYDGSVLFTAMFKSAFTFNKSGNTLIEYCGIDEDVTVPDREGAVTAITSDAFVDNTIMTSLTIPDSIETIEPHALTGCQTLQTLVFDQAFPQNAAGDALVESGTPPVYLKQGDARIFLGWYADEYTVRFMQNVSGAFQ